MIDFEYYYQINMGWSGRVAFSAMVEQGPTVLAEGATWEGVDIFSFVNQFSFLSPSIWEMARYRHRYCPQGPLNPKQQQRNISKVLHTSHTENRLNHTSC